jgi:hypothetical protein
LLYEYRLYEAMPGKLDALVQRFTDGEPFRKKHGIRMVGMWQPVIGGASNQLVLLLAWESLQEREERWGAFFRDRAWQRVMAQSEKDGPLAERVSIQIWKPTPNSPMQ